MVNGNVSASGLHVLANYPDYALYVEHTRIDIEFENTVPKTELRQSFLGISVAEDLNNWLKGRLAAGNVGYSLKNAAPGDQFDPSGVFWSLAFESYVPITNAIALASTVNYRYVKVEDTVNAETLRYTLNNVRAEISGVFKLHTDFSFEIGSSALWVEGRERFTTGNVATTRDFEADETVSGFVRGIFHVGTNGHVGISAGGGAEDSVSVYFKHAY